MKKANIKTIVIYVAVFILTVIAIIAVYTYARSYRVAEGTISYDIYYINDSSKILDTEERMVNYVDDDRTMFNTVVDEFAKGPSVGNQQLTLPADFKISKKEYRDRTAYIDLEEGFYNMGSSDRTLSICAIVYTLTDMSFIDGVEITVGSKPYYTDEEGNTMVLNRQNVRNNPMIDPEKTQWQTVTLYFADRSGNELISEQRSIKVKNSLTLEYQIMEQLIAGPEKNLILPSVPNDTAIRDIKTEDGICYVNLSKSFINEDVDGIESKNITIYSVVNSLTELESVNRVQFLIDGEKVSDIEGVDFSKTFERNPSLIKE